MLEHNSQIMLNTVGAIAIVGLLITGVQQLFPQVFADIGNRIQEVIPSSQPATKTPVIDDAEFSNFDYSVNSDNSSTMTITRYYGSDTDLVIPDERVQDGKTYTVTKIDDSAFSWKSSLKTIDLGSITEMGPHAFMGDDSLTTVKTGHLTKIGAYAFDDCSSLESIDLGHVTDLGDYAFWDATSLKKVDTSSLKNVGTAPFCGTGVTYP